VGEYAFTKIELTTNQQFNGLVVKESYRDKLLPEYLFYIASTFKAELIRLSGKTSFNFVSVSTLKTIKIPLPPLEVQEQIVAEIQKRDVGILEAKNKILQLEQEKKDVIAKLWSE
jgi:restriction endonuclease S subunit